MNELTDEQLILEVQRGQRNLLSILVKRYYQPLFSYLYRYSGNPTLAEDLVQETFVTLLKQTTYQPGRPFRPWLYAIAHNLAHNHFNSAATGHERGYLNLSDEAEAGEHEYNLFCPLTFNPDAGDPQELIMRREESQEIAAAFQQLSDEYRLTLILRFYSEFSLAEIAETLDIPLGTVKSRLSVGVRKLRALLEAGKQLEKEIGGK